MDETTLFAGGTILFTIVIIVVSLAAAIIPMVLVFRWLGKMGAKNQALMNNGVAAQARVVQMGPTGLTINDAPQMNVVLEVHPPPQPGYRGAAAPFMATVQALVPIYAMGRVQPGAMLPVKFDPMNPMNVAIDFRSMGFM
jgi:hypothetical protein